MNCCAKSSCAQKIPMGQEHCRASLRLALCRAARMDDRILAWTVELWSVIRMCWATVCEHCVEHWLLWPPGKRQRSLLLPGPQCAPGVSTYSNLEHGIASSYGGVSSSACEVILYARMWDLLTHCPGWRRRRWGEVLGSGHSSPHRDNHWPLLSSC